jgi:hypothetical protein
VSAVEMIMKEIIGTLVRDNMSLLTLNLIELLDFQR